MIFPLPVFRYDALDDGAFPRACADKNPIPVAIFNPDAVSYAAYTKPAPLQMNTVPRFIFIRVRSG
ncbi:hypothetical protein D3C73_1618790 [compost metagenome]